MLPKVFVVVLNLNAYTDTKECLESLRQVQYPNFNIVVVDNGSSDGSFVRLQTDFPEATVLRNEVNLGFTGGNNLGIEHALQHDADYVLLLNNDTVVDSNLLMRLAQVGETDGQIGILGPKIFYASDPQRIWYAGGRILRASCTHVGQDELDVVGRYARIVDTAFITGCAMLIKCTVFEKVGLLDDKLFIYHEDTDFCVRATKAGYRCVFVPAARVWHKVSRTCGRASPFTLYLSTRNQLRWVSNHVSFPYRSSALSFTLAKKLIKMVLLLPKDRISAAAIWAGITAFFRNASGPPGPEMRPERQMQRLG